MFSGGQTHRSAPTLGSTGLRACAKIVWNRNTMENREILKVEKLRKNFGGLQALNDASFSVKKGQITGLIGPNGAGKTTTINIISGVFQPSSGRIVFDGLPVNGLSTHEIARRGIVRTFQNVLLFNRLTVLENILCGSLLRSGLGLVQCALGLSSAKRGHAAAMERAAAYALLLGLESETGRRAGELPLAKQRAVEIARAMATEPKLLLLDEPGAGLTQEEAANLAAIIRNLRQEKELSILLIDHNMSLVMGLCQEIAVMNFGEIIADGPSGEVVNSQAVREAYLGEPIAAG